ncbi:hypothetical protein HN643_06235 [Candidatus Falkowbacteria bacterium]|mgnify:CR=1 FL=1|jgi:hypothetical protein|nr:hypothetical protein [Candidatus Falkowbacteria bacterium]MBT6573839.1 hypothetical protein [Candidatus Falkowbacteria bacterium]MBT7501232.1 hypothetical protein [Candidatus Falkowbacteria bacterium]
MKNHTPETQKVIHLSMVEKFLYAMFPDTFNRYLFRRYGAKSMDFRLAAFLFTRGRENRKVDMFPRGGNNGRGFDIVLDNKFLMRFEQEGGHFEMTSIDLGKFENCEPAALDNL